MELGKKIEIKWFETINYRISLVANSSLQLSDILPYALFTSNSAPGFDQQLSLSLSAIGVWQNGLSQLTIVEAVSHSSTSRQFCRGPLPQFRTPPPHLKLKIKQALNQLIIL
eukprot:2147840-Amphidinium_carterae.2